MSRSYAVVVNECVAVAHLNQRQVRFRQTKNAEPNFKMSPESLVAGLPRELYAHELDWLELMVAMYATDLACVRGKGDLDWGRDIELHVPLRDPSRMEPHRIALQEAFADLTSDRLRMIFYEETNPLPAPRYGREWPEFDCVALFSGGVDSFVGAASLMSAGRTPLFLSHGSGANTTPQRNARDFLNAKFGTRPHTRVAAEQATGFGASENSQRARSLLFMGAAALVAAVAGVDEVFINENGVMAVHVPLTTARFGSLSTKTAYPPIVERVASTASAVLDSPNLRIDNRLVHMTKPEVVAEAIRVGVQGGLPQTASCWTWQRKRQHCGVCAPCLMRRISFEIEKVAETAYIADPFDNLGDVSRPFARDNMSHLCQVVEQIEGLTDFDFELDHPEILDGGRMIAPSDARDLYRRWAQQALSVLRAHPVSKTFLSGT